MLLVLLLSILLLSGCVSSSPCEWYIAPAESSSEVDVFYVVSTNVLNSLDADGNDTYRAALTEDDKDLFSKEAAYIHEKFGPEMTVYAPYYHQFTLSSMTLPEGDFVALRADVSEEVCDDFDYYMSHYNKGHRFILCGFSQGAMHVIDILKHMTDEQYSLCIAAYSLGYRLSDDDLSNPHVKAATGETDLGVTVSFNSVADTSAIWAATAEGSATCINPVNWCTDATPAEMFSGDVDVTVSVDTTTNVLIVAGVDPAEYTNPALAEFCKPGNLHLCDLLLYSDLIGRNAAVRAGLQSSK